MFLDSVVGYCKECGSPVLESDELIPEHEGIYECRRCHHPHSIDELWQENLSCFK